jgi:hypothetical protein
MLDIDINAYFSKHLCPFYKVHWTTSGCKHYIQCLPLCVLAQTMALPQSVRMPNEPNACFGLSLGLSLASLGKMWRRVVSCELRVESCELRVKSYEQVSK